MDLFPRGNVHLHPAYELPRPCGATRPPLHGDAGWECTGKGLIVVMTVTSGGQSLPVVLPRRALEIIDPEPWWDSPVNDFVGGDHLHLKVPRRPANFRGDSVLIYGDQAVSCKLTGATTDDAQVYLGLPHE